jgi:hypothetical protein
MAAGLIVVAFCLILLWRDPRMFWTDDYQLSILPVFADIARSWKEGTFPLLSPYSWVCSNLAGEFQYGTFSVFANATIVLVWKFPFTFVQQAFALTITHLFVLAAGAFLLARGRQFSVQLSIFVALVAALNGWIVYWGVTDWFPAISAFTWLPWAWWGLERALDRQRTRYRFLWPAPFVYLLVTGGSPYMVLMLLLLVAWLSIKSLVHTKNLISILPMLFGAALGFGLSAPAWLALLNYVHGSARELQPNAAHWQWLVPPAALPGLIFPGWTVPWIQFSGSSVPHAAAELTCGLCAPAALVAGFIRHGRLLVRRFKWELLLLLLVLLLSMLPMTGLFRWSFRWLPFFHLALAICAAEALRLRPGLPVASTSLVLLIVVMFPMSIFNSAGNYGVQLMLIYFAIVVFWTVAEWVVHSAKFREWAPAAATFALLLATYFCIPPDRAVPKFNLSQKLTEPAPLDPQRLYLSLHPSPQFAYVIEKKSEPIGQIVRPGNTSMWAALRFINGYSPIRPAGVARDLDFFTHGETDLATGKYLLYEQSGAGGWLATLGVDGIVVAKEIDVDPAPLSGWELVFSNDEGRVFHRRGPPLEPVRSMTTLDSRPGEEFSVAQISRIDDSRNRLSLNVDVPAGGKPALLIFSRPHFPGYQARLNTQKLLVDSYRGWVPIVQLPPGSRGRLLLSYYPNWLAYGIVIAAASFVTFAGGILIALKASRSPL